MCRIGTSCEAEDIAFKLAPRINAAARMGRAELAVQLVVTDDETQAQDLAQQLDAANKERQAAERALLRELEAQLADVPDGEAIVLAGPGWNPGLLGLVGGRLARARRVPAALVGLREDGPCKGSTRSIAGFDVRAVLNDCADRLVTFGGHAMASGFTLLPEHFDAFRSAFQEAWRRHRDTVTEQPPREYDGELPLAALTQGLVGSLDRLGPFGEGNRRPVLGTLGVTVVQARRMGGDGSHLQVQLAQGPASLRGVAFGAGDEVDALPSGLELDVLYTPKINRFRGRADVELELVEMRPRAGSATGA